MNVDLSPLEIDFLLRELQANQGMISPSASIPAWYRHSIQETLRDALLADRKAQWALEDQRLQERSHAEEKEARLVRKHSCTPEGRQTTSQARQQGSANSEGV
tara:strand:+ start:1012 stop:1320 length:309 start_codon:yes stop_codon:yes gene_type:complete